MRQQSGTPQRSILSSMSSPRTAAAALAAGLVLISAPTASAHVTVTPNEVAKGGYAVIAFRVPNESDTAGTVKLEAKLPDSHTLTAVRTKPMPGWTANQTRRTLTTPVESHGSKISEVVDTITWTAQPGTRIAPGEFHEFELSVGKLPDNVDQMVIKATQTYEDGKVVAWDTPPTSGAEPERPAPVLKLVAGPAGDGHGGTTEAAGTTGGADNTARLLGGMGLGVGALGLGIGIGGLVRGRRKA